LQKTILFFTVTHTQQTVTPLAYRMSLLSTGRTSAFFNFLELYMKLSERFTDALIFASHLHANQTRKGGGIPYIAHLLGVASIALEHGANEDEAIAALLHDAIEDQGGDATRQEIRRRFGDTVTDIVNGCTDADTTPKPPWRDRKEAYIAHIPKASPSVRLVAAADKLYNARSVLNDYRLIGEAVWERFQGGKDGSLWYYRAVVEALRTVESNPLIDELDRVVSELERLVNAATND
jgi:GTP pyrophosphokinase